MMRVLDRRGAFRVARLLHLNGALAGVAYVVLGELFLRGGMDPFLADASGRVEDESLIRVAGYAATFVILAVALLLAFVRWRPLAVVERGVVWDEVGLSRRLLRYHVVVAALCEAPAVLAFVVYLLAETRLELYLQSGAAVMALILTAPHRERWNRAFRAAGLGARPDEPL